MLRQPDKVCLCPLQNRRKRRIKDRRIANTGYYALFPMTSLICPTHGLVIEDGKEKLRMVPEMLQVD